MNKAKFKVGDKVVFVARYGKEGKVFTIDVIETFKGVTTIYLEEVRYPVYDHEIELAGPYAKWHAIAREICGENHE